MPVACAVRVQQHRARQRNGETQITLTINEVVWASRLIEARLLEPTKADDHRAIQQAMQRWHDILSTETETQ